MKLSATQLRKLVLEEVERARSKQVNESFNDQGDVESLIRQLAEELVGELGMGVGSPEDDEYLVEIEGDIRDCIETIRRNISKTKHYGRG